MIDALIERIEGFKNLKTGWWDGDSGEVFDPVFVDEVKAILLKRITGNCPSSLPTEEGGILLEHFDSICHWAVAIEFHPNRKISFDCFHYTSDDCVNVTGDFDSESLWKFIFDTLKFLGSSNVHSKSR